MRSSNLERADGGTNAEPTAASATGAGCWPGSHPHRLVVTWQINGEWQLDADPEHASEIEVRFTPDGPEQTTVELEHRHLAASSPAGPSTTPSAKAAAGPRYLTRSPKPQGRTRNRALVPNATRRHVRTLGRSVTSGRTAAPRGG
ncbi:MAG: SRPBCC domain-containing protein [Acidimicrobiales bacterium]